MHQQQTSQNLIKLGILGVVIITLLILISIFKLITTSYILSLMIVVVLVYLLLRKIGAFVMYPGSSFYTTSDIEIRLGKELTLRMYNFITSLKFLSENILKKQWEYGEYPLDSTSFLTHINSIIELYTMFERTLSPRKLNILNIYKSLQHIFVQKLNQEDFSLEYLLNNRRPNLTQLHQHEHLFLVQQITHILRLSNDLALIIQSFLPPEGTFQKLKYRIFKEKFYQIRFGFQNWKRVYHYEVHKIKTSDGEILQAAVIHNKKNSNTLDENTDQKTVLFCNPNGVFIQFFATENQYVHNYLKLGYKVILWNYRGYGQSTGSPSISKSQVDAYTIFRYFNEKQFEIKIVHGYSIGGPAAVGLLNLLQINYDKSNQVQILIVDRSFASIGEMSLEFGEILHKIVKVVFMFDNIDISKQFEAIKCKKLLIWDFCDEIIPDKASLKSRIMKRRKQLSIVKANSSSESSILNKPSTYSNNDEDLEAQEQLNEDVLQNLNQMISTAAFDELINQFEYLIRSLVNRIPCKSTQQKEENIEFSEHDHRSTQMSSLSMEEEQVDYLIKELKRIDGGGIDIFSNMNELRCIINHKANYYNHICESYILGLVYYGSFFPLKEVIHDYLQVKTQTLHKIQNTLQTILRFFKINIEDVANFYYQDSIDQLAKNTCYVLKQLEAAVKEHFNQNCIQQFGSLLPTNNGHNSNLNFHEFYVLNQFIKRNSQQESKKSLDERESISPQKFERERLIEQD